jgi:hypothetical protein
VTCRGLARDESTPRWDLEMFGGAEGVVCIVKSDKEGSLREANYTEGTLHLRRKRKC